LANLISDAPARCILLLEDLDCAFPTSREDGGRYDNEIDQTGRLTARRAQSKVTLSGLLNVLDSVSSEEGRITFATVCFILYGPDTDDHSGIELTDKSYRKSRSGAY
jgi:hypothetical protein